MFSLLKNGWDHDVLVVFYLCFIYPDDDHIPLYIEIPVVTFVHLDSGPDQLNPQLLSATIF